MRKAIIFALIAIIVVGIFLSINTISQNEDLEESMAEEVVNAEEQVAEPQGRNLSVQLDEKMGFSAP